MADVLTAKLIGSKELQRRLKKMSPERNARIVNPALQESGLLVARIAARDKIFAGGSGPAKAKILTSRSGTLRRSLTSNTAVQLNRAQHFVFAGTHLGYGALHEKGGTVGIPSHSRTSKLGNRFEVRAHSAKFPARPFLKPALSDAERRFEDIFTKHWRRAGEVG